MSRMSSRPVCMQMCMLLLVFVQADTFSEFQLRAKESSFNSRNLTLSSLLTNGKEGVLLDWLGWLVGSFSALMTACWSLSPVLIGATNCLSGVRLHRPRLAKKYFVRITLIFRFQSKFFFVKQNKSDTIMTKIVFNHNLVFKKLNYVKKNVIFVHAFKYVYCEWTSLRIFVVTFHNEVVNKGSEKLDS